MSATYGAETPLNDLVESALAKMASGEWRLILEHPNPAQGSSVCGFEVGKEIARRALAPQQAAPMPGVPKQELDALVARLTRRWEDSDEPAAKKINRLLRDCREAADVLSSLATPEVRTSEPVAWRCKDYADSWILFNVGSYADAYRQETGCLMQPLYTHPAPAQAPVDGEAVRRAVGEAIVTASNMADGTIAIDSEHLVIAPAGDAVRIDLRKLAAALAAPEAGTSEPTFVPCDGCDGYECIGRCAYPGVEAVTSEPVEAPMPGVNMDRLYRAAKRLSDNIAEFGTVTDGEFINDIDAALSALATPEAGTSEPVVEDEDEAYEIGKRDGYSDAVQEIDMLTGGDGEYRYCTDHDPDRHTPDPATMIQRIVDRFETLNILDEAIKAEQYVPAPAQAPVDGGAVRALREQVESLVCRGYDNGVTLVSLNAVLALIDATPEAGTSEPMSKRYCQCKNVTNPCIVCGRPKFIDREWLKRKIESDGDEGEVGAGFELFPLPTPESGTSEPVAEPFAFCCSSFDINACDCVNKDHGHARRGGTHPAPPPR